MSRESGARTPHHVLRCTSTVADMGQHKYPMVERVKAVRAAMRSPGHLEVPAVPGVAVRCRPALSNASAPHMCAVSTDTKADRPAGTTLW